jgi:two-component SAPR family response regulator
MGELVNKIKAIQPKIKVILISAFEINYIELKKAFPEIKVDSLISKPVSLRNLQKTIDRHLN